MPQACSRGQSGFAVATILVIGVIACLWMLGTASVVTPAIGRISKERTSDIMRCSAEAGLDWAVQELNNPQTRSSIDNNTTSIPSSVMSNSSISGTVNVLNQAAPQTSYLYDPLCDPNNQVAPVQGGNGWRVLTAAVSNGVFRKQVRVILKPIYVVSYTTTTSTTTGPPTPIFNSVMFGKGNISAPGNVVTNSYNSSTNPHPFTFNNTGGDVATDTSMSLAGNSQINGNINVFSTPMGSSTTVLQGTENVSVNGNIATNGGASGITPTQVSGTYSTQQSQAPPVLPQTPQAPSTATNLGTVDISGNNMMTLYSGDYIVSSLSISGNGKLVIQPSNGPVNIYVQGAGSTNGVNISGNGVSNLTIPSNLRIWYGGTGPVQVAGNGTFTGVVYAPNSNMSVSGNGQVYGSLVGNTINLNGNASFHYDMALRQNSALMWNPPITTTTTSTVSNLDHYQAVSWEEF